MKHDPNPPRQFRLDPDSVVLLERLDQKLALGPSGVVRLALRRLAELEKVSLPVGKRKATGGDGG